MMMELCTEIRGRRVVVIWEDGVLTGDPDTLERLRRLKGSDTTTPETTVTAVERAIGARPTIRVRHAA